MTDFAISALAHKCAELAGECEAQQASLDRMRCDLATSTPRSVSWTRAPRPS